MVRHSLAMLATGLASLSPSLGACAAETRYFVNFGDSYTQTGFNIDGEKPSSSNPIGNPPLPGWTSTGGFNWVGFLATEYNTDELLTYNFAYGGATTDSDLIPPYAPEVLSFVDQVGQFSASLGTNPDYAPWTAENTLFGVWIGVNDVGNTFWLPDREDILTAVLDRYFEQVQVLYDAGARRFALLSVPPTDLTPAFQEKPANEIAIIAETIAFYNGLIESHVEDFKAANGNVTVHIVDTAAPFNKAIENPTEYGAPDALCFNNDGTSCLWHDDYHPGIAINELVAGQVAEAVGAPFF